MKKIIITLILIILAALIYFVYNKKDAALVENIPVNNQASSTVIAKHNDWITYSGDTFTFVYPATFGANVWSTSKWPPKVTAVLKNEDAVAKGCTNINSGNPIIKKTGTTTDGLLYESYYTSDAGAGSLYSSYCYVISAPKNNYAFYFEIRSHLGCQNKQCGAYCGTEYEQECRDFDITKQVESPILEIVNSFKVK